jgi:carbonic anhydrase/acetyltransferase-like protein (isoleucine patch superfamily)
MRGRWPDRETGSPSGHVPLLARSVLGVSDELEPGDQVRHPDGRGVVLKVEGRAVEVVWFSDGNVVVKGFDRGDLVMVDPARPQIDPSAFLAQGAIVRGDVRIGPRASVWFYAVLRGDEGPIVVGEGSNIQDNAVLHSDLGSGVEIGRWVSVGHGAVVRGAQVGDDTMIGMNATIMTGAVIGAQSIVGAGSFVPLGAKFPAGSMIVGMPARVVRQLTEAERGHPRVACDIYLRLVEWHRSGKSGAPT